MGNPTVNQAAQLSAGAPGTAMIGPNTVVRGQPGLLGTAQDALSFANGGTGFWAVANTRARTHGVFLVSATAQGTATLPTTPPSTVPIVVVMGDARIRSR